MNFDPKPLLQRDQNDPRLSSTFYRQVGFVQHLQPYQKLEELRPLVQAPIRGEKEYERLLPAVRQYAETQLAAVEVFPINVRCRLNTSEPAA